MRLAVLLACVGLVLAVAVWAGMEGEQREWQQVSSVVLVPGGTSNGTDTGVTANHSRFGSSASGVATPGVLRRIGGLDDERSDHLPWAPGLPGVGPDASADLLAVQALPDETAAAPESRPVGSPVAGAFIVTHYGESYDGQNMGCTGAGPYRSADPTIVAVGPSRYREWPCGTRLRVSGLGGSIDVVRTDSCPGCGHNHLDLSEAGIALVCGPFERLQRCEASVEVVG